MVRAWYMDADSSVDQCKPHQTDPLQPVTLEELAKLGVLYFKIEGASDCDWDKHEVLSKIRKERGYTYEDAITCSREKMPDLDDKLVSFFTEHIHSDEEIRLITEGSGYFDVRDTNDRWIRIEVVANDMIILPAGIYHRFTLDEKHYIQARRYFVGEPVWTPVNRPADDHKSRLAYLKTHGSA